MIWKGYNNSFNSWISKKDFSEPQSLGKVKVELDFPNYATDLKKCYRNGYIIFY